VEDWGTAGRVEDGVGSLSLIGVRSKDLDKEARVLCYLLLVKEWSGVWVRREFPRTKSSKVCPFALFKYDSQT